jgi:hypothetical protein
MYPTLNPVKTFKPIWILVVACTISRGTIHTKEMMKAMIKPTK